MKISRTQLAKLGACNDGKKAFKAAFPVKPSDKIELNAENIAHFCHTNDVGFHSYIDWLVKLMSADYDAIRYPLSCLYYDCHNNCNTLQDEVRQEIYAIFKQLEQLRLQISDVHTADNQIYKGVHERVDAEFHTEYGLAWNEFKAASNDESLSEAERRQNLIDADIKMAAIDVYKKYRIADEIKRERAEQNAKVKIKSLQDEMNELEAKRTQMLKDIFMKAYDPYFKRTAETLDQLSANFVQA